MLTKLRKVAAERAEIISRLGLQLLDYDRVSHRQLTLLQEFWQLGSAVHSEEQEFESRRLAGLPLGIKIGD